MAPHDILGTIGVGFIIVMYAMLQLDKISAEQPAFSAFNALAPSLFWFHSPTSSICRPS